MCVTVHDSYVQARLGETDDWPLRTAASVALGAPLGLRLADDRLKYESVMGLWKNLAAAIRSRELEYVACLPPEDAKSRLVFQRRPSGDFDRWPFGDFDFSSLLQDAVAHPPTQRHTPARDFYHLATVRPDEVAKWLRRSKLAQFAVELERVLSELRGSRRKKGGPYDFAGVTSSDSDAISEAARVVWREYWEMWDPTLAKTTAVEIEDWLINKCKVKSRSIATKIQRAARPKEAKGGGRPRTTREA